ncbi:MAG: histidine triad nucleotide-binding protein [Thermodesulfobacteriota bacterium]
MECIFCKVVSGDIPSTKVHETDSLIAIEDIDPQAPTHILVLPKKHYANIVECDDEALLGEFLKVAGEIATKLGIVESGFRTVINTNDEGGQTVFHLHMHLLAGRPLSGRMG